MVGVQLEHVGVFRSLFRNAVSEAVCVNQGGSPGDPNLQLLMCIF